MRYLMWSILGVLFTGFILYLASVLDGETHNKRLCLQVEPKLVFVKGGNFVMGEGGVYAEEFPARETTVDDFWISSTEVTNGEFAVFVEATGYITVAERHLSQEHYPDIAPQFLKPGSAVFVSPEDAIVAGTPFNWWHFIEGANWRHPQGPSSDIDGLDYPVVHIAFDDAQAYASWKGGRLPTEAEFEYAARGGTSTQSYVVGEPHLVNGEYQANTWQGFFPFVNNAEDGYEGLSPVGCFKANGYGLSDMIGNVWEWTSSYYYPKHINSGDELKHYHSDKGFDPRQPNTPVKTVKGGSYLCSPDFCARFRPAARQAQDTGLGSSHIGFRIVKSVNNPTSG